MTRSLLAVALLFGCAITATTSLAQPGIRHEVVTPQDYGAKADGVTDDTSAIQSAIDARKHVHFPEGVYRVNPTTGIVVRTGSVLTGDGQEASVLWALPGAGSIIKRLAPKIRGDYVSNVKVESLAVVLQHDDPKAEQIAFDLRHITRSIVRDCYAGNFPRANCKAAPKTQPAGQQGYGILIGTYSSGTALYSGGESNRVDSVTVWGTRKAITLDDLSLTPNSAAHGTIVTNCDIQAAEIGISQESRFTSQCAFRDNSIQSIQRAVNSTATTYGIWLNGTLMRVDGGFVEVVANCDYTVRLDATTANCVVSIPRVAASKNGMADAGKGNVCGVYGK